MCWRKASLPVFTAGIKIERSIAVRSRLGTKEKHAGPRPE